MFYLLVAVALGVGNKALQNCATLDKAVITVKALENEIGEECAAPYLDVVRTFDRFEVVRK